MSLILYLHEKDLPESVKLCNKNDQYFNGSTLLQDSDIVKRILKRIDRADYNSPETFIGRDKSLGALYRENLSTGCKTLLNIVSNPDICFSLLECGANAKELALQLTEGQALWYADQLNIEDEVLCDVVCNGKHFTRVGDLIDFIDSEV